MLLKDYAGSAVVAGVPVLVCICDTQACLHTRSWCDAGDRKSKRARKGRAPIKVSADDKLGDLKLKIVQTLNVHPENALLHVFRDGQWQVLSDAEARLAGTLQTLTMLYLDHSCV